MSETDPQSIANSPSSIQCGEISVEVANALKSRGLVPDVVGGLLVGENRLALLQALDEIPEGSFEFFWKTDIPFSQHYPATFEIDGITFNCSEQYMMHQKAMFFGDTQIAKEILKEPDPKKQKDLGKQVKGFDEAQWNAVCREIVYRGNHAKFTQNPDLLQALLNTSGKTLVEASPYDRKWGIGLRENDIRSNNPSEWLGTNWLGIILTVLREDLLKQK